jgi:flagellar basal body-associated protein FliL
VKTGNFFSELKRRNVYKVAIAYSVAGWLVIQVATQVFPFLEIPNWVVRLVIALVVLGFPVAAISAWAFEITRRGIKRTEQADALPESEYRRPHAWIYGLTTPIA